MPPIAAYPRKIERERTKMKTRLTAMLITLVALAFVVGLVLPGPANAQNLRRLSAEFFNFDASETSTIVTPAAGGTGGDLIYSRVITTANANDILYVTISGTADQHDGALLMMCCNVDSGAGEVPCNAGGGGASVAPSGWIAIQKTVVPTGGSTNCDDGGGGAGDCHDTSYYVTWCTGPLGFSSARTVNIRMATDIGSPGPPEIGRVFIEQNHVYIDASATIGGCKEAGS
jgi:hypothetical protein